MNVNTKKLHQAVVDLNKAIAELEGDGITVVLFEKHQGGFGVPTRFTALVQVPVVEDPY